MRALLNLWRAHQQRRARRHQMRELSAAIDALRVSLVRMRSCPAYTLEQIQRRAEVDAAIQMGEQALAFLKERV